MTEQFSQPLPEDQPLPVEIVGLNLALDAQPSLLPELPADPKPSPRPERAADSQPSLLPELVPDNQPSLLPELTPNSSSSPLPKPTPESPASSQPKLPGDSPSAELTADTASSPLASPAGSQRSPRLDQPTASVPSLAPKTHPEAQSPHRPQPAANTTPPAKSGEAIDLQPSQAIARAAAPQPAPQSPATPPVQPAASSTSSESPSPATKSVAAVSTQHTKITESAFSQRAPQQPAPTTAPATAQAPQPASVQSPQAASNAAADVRPATPARSSAPDASTSKASTEGDSSAETNTVKLIGKAADGSRLLLMDADGNRFELLVDDRLMSLVAREQRKAEAEQKKPVRKAPPPREIQERVRAGESAAQIAASAGVDVAAIDRFALPVLIERGHIAQQASTCLVRMGNDHLPLDELIAQHLGGGSATITVEWDAWRTEEGTWTVTASFAGPNGTRSAQFDYSPSENSIRPVDDRARMLFVQAVPDKPQVDGEPEAAPSVKTAKTSAPQASPQRNAVPREDDKPANAPGRTWDRAHPAARAHERRAAAESAKSAESSDSTKSADTATPTDSSNGAGVSKAQSEGSGRTESSHPGQRTTHDSAGPQPRETRPAVPGSGAPANRFGQSSHPGGSRFDNKLNDQRVQHANVVAQPVSTVKPTPAANELTIDIRTPKKSQEPPQWEELLFGTPIDPV